MTGCKKYYRIPILTKLFEIRFYIYWRDDKLYRIGFNRHHGCKMTFEQALTRLENKRIRREKFNQ